MDWNYAKAEKMIRQNFKQETTAVGVMGLARIAMRESRISEALTLIASGPDLAYPSEAAGLYNFQALFLQIAGEYERSLVPLEKVLNMLPQGQARALALAIKIGSLQLLERRREMDETTELLWQEENGRYRLVFWGSFAGTLRQEDALNLLKNSRLGVSDGQKALMYTRLGELDAAFDALEKCIINHNNFIADSLRVAPYWDPLRADPRYEKMVQLLESEETHTLRYRDRSGVQ